MENIRKFNESLKTEVFENKISQIRARDFCKDIGVDADNKQYGR